MIPDQFWEHFYYLVLTILWCDYNDMRGQWRYLTSLNGHVIVSLDTSAVFWSHDHASSNPKQLLYLWLPQDVAFSY